jgi:uncharacterized protein YjbI with pentapeptide repeats
VSGGAATAGSYRWDVFLAHASADGHVAERLYDRLSAHARVFLDSRTLRLAAPWDSQIAEAQASSRVTVALISSKAAESFYVRAEIQKAISMSRQPGTPHSLVPVFLEPMQNIRDMPYGVELIQGIRLFDGARIAEAAQSILDLLAGADESAGSEESALMRIRRLVAGTASRTTLQSRKSLGELRAYVSSTASETAREAALELVKELLCDRNTGDTDVSGAHDRGVGAEMMACIREFAVHPLRTYFANGEFEGVDLYGMNFERTDLTGVSFAGAFLVESTFLAANLEAASFRDCCIRNVNLQDARLTGADLTGADWFNALGLTRAQLAEVKPDTLLACPPDLQSMLDYLPGKYAFPFESWAASVQRDLRRAWAEYLTYPASLRRN